MLRSQPQLQIRSGSHQQIGCYSSSIPLQRGGVKTHRSRFRARGIPSTHGHSIQTWKRDFRASSCVCIESLISRECFKESKLSNSKHHQSFREALYQDLASSMLSRSLVPRYCRLLFPLCLRAQSSVCLIKRSDLPAASTCDWKTLAVAASSVMIQSVWRDPYLLNAPQILSVLVERIKNKAYEHLPH